jgi:hypothetical protein
MAMFAQCDASAKSSMTIFAGFRVGIDHAVTKRTPDTDASVHTSATDGTVCFYVCSPEHVYGDVHAHHIPITFSNASTTVRNDIVQWFVTRALVVIGREVYTDPIVYGTQIARTLGVYTSDNNGHKYMRHVYDDGHRMMRELRARLRK